jgi:hypothetical protein
MFHNISSPEEIAHLKNDQSLEQIAEQLDKDFEQLVIRAHSGSTRAAATLVLRIIKFVRTLDALTDAHSSALDAISIPKVRIPIG